MTHQQNLETIRQACIKANPSIMELGFGCEIQFEGKICTVLHEKYSCVWFIWYENGIKKEACPPINHEGIKILGRPIRLADVLLAIGKQNKVKPGLNLYSIELEFLLAGADIDNALWDLIKDDIREQSEESISFLSELLK